MRHEVSFAGLLVLLSAGQAFADPLKPSPNVPTPYVPDAPRAPLSENQRLLLIEKGKGLTREGQYPEAIEVLRKALEVRPDPRVLLWLGYAQEQMGTLLAARASYLEAKTVAHAGKLVGEERNADQALLDIAPKIPRIAVKLSPGVEAKLWIDGKEIQPSGEGVQVDPGAHRVVVIGPGWNPYRRAAIAKLGELNVVEPILTRLPPPSAPTPAPREKITNASPADALVVVGTTSAALGAAMGTGFAILSEVKRHERNRLWKGDSSAPCHNTAIECEKSDAAERARGHFLTATLVSFLSAGALGAGTLTYALVTREKKTQGEATATVSAGPGGVTGVVRVTW